MTKEIKKYHVVFKGLQPYAQFLNKEVDQNGEGTYLFSTATSVEGEIQTEFTETEIRKFPDEFVGAINLGVLETKLVTEESSRHNALTNLNIQEEGY